jgi:hypothetical protein
MLTRAGRRKGLAVIPRHPCLRILGQLDGVFLQLGEIVEGIGVVQFAGVDQAHEQVTHPGALLGLIEQAVLATTEIFP